MEKKYLNPKEIIEATGLSRPFVYELFNRCDFPAIKIGRRLLVPAEAFEAWMREQKTAGQLQGSQNA